MKSKRKLSLLIFLIIGIIGSNLYSQIISEDILTRISIDFKNNSLHNLDKRNEHFQLELNENGKIEFYIDSIDPSLFFNYKTKSEVINWLGTPDSILVIEDKVDYCLYEISSIKKGCNLYFTYGIPKPIPKSIPLPEKGQVISIEFICVQDCKDLNELNDLKIKFLKISFRV